MLAGNIVMLLYSLMADAYCHVVGISLVVSEREKRYSGH